MRTIQIIFTISLFFLFSCSQENKDWELVIETNTFKAYKEFVDKYPDKKTEELDNALWTLISSFPNEKDIIYEGFRLRGEPNANSELITKLQSGQVVRIVEKSQKKETIEISGYSATDYWYKIDLKNNTEGWTFGAGLKTDNVFFETCKLYLEILPNGKNKGNVDREFQKCDCNLWEEIKKDDEKSAFLSYIEQFPRGIYVEDAQIISSFLDTTLCFEYENRAWSQSDYDYFKETITLTLKKDDVDGKLEGMSDMATWGGELKGKRIGKTLKLIYLYEISDEIGQPTNEEEYSILLSNKSSILSKNKGQLFKLVDCN